MLEKYDPDAIYIIGAYVDKVIFFSFYSVYYLIKLTMFLVDSRPEEQVDEIKSIWVNSRDDVMVCFIITSRFIIDEIFI